MNMDLQRIPKQGFALFWWRLGLAWKFYFAIIFPLLLLPLVFVFVKDDDHVWMDCELEPRKSTVYVFKLQCAIEEQFLQSIIYHKANLYPIEISSGLCHSCGCCFLDVGNHAFGHHLYASDRPLSIPWDYEHGGSLPILF